MDLLRGIREEMAFEANVRKSYLYRFLMNLQLWWPIWVLYLQQDRGLSLTQITLLDTPFFLLVVLAEIPTGAVADRFGRRTSLMLGSALFAVAVFIFGIADSYLIILLSYTAWGLGQTFQSGADSALLYDSLKQIGREDAFQKINQRLWAITSLAVLIAILIGAPIAEATSYTFAIVLSAIIAAIAIPVAYSMHEAPHQPEEGRDRYLQTVAHGVRDAWNRPALRYIFLFSGLLLAGTFTPLVFQQVFLDEHGVAVGSVGLWQAPVRAAGIAGSLAAGFLLLRLGTRGAFFALPITLTLCNFVLAGVDHSWAFTAFLGFGLVAGLQNPVLATYINQRIPSERRATMLSVQNVVGNVIFAFVQPMGGLIADQWGLQAVFLAFGTGTLVLGTAVLLLWVRAEKDEDDLDELNRELLDRERHREAIPAS